MPSDRTARAIQPCTKCFIMCPLRCPWKLSNLRIAPDNVANRDLPWNQAELEEAVGHALLGWDDVFSDGPDGEGRTIGRDGLNVEANAGDGAQASCHLLPMRLRPFCGRRRHVDDLLQDQSVVFREITIGDIEGIGL